MFVSGNHSLKSGELKTRPLIGAGTVGHSINSSAQQYGVPCSFAGLKKKKKTFPDLLPTKHLAYTYAPVGISNPVSGGADRGKGSGFLFSFFSFFLRIPRNFFSCRDPRSFFLVLVLVMIYNTHV